MSNEQFIGRGEKEVIKFLKLIFPHASVVGQVPIHKLVKDEDYEILDQEIKNHNFDIVVYNGPNILVIEVNYKHKEKAAMKWSNIFVKMLVDAGRIPVTIEDYNCEFLFTDSERLKKQKPWGPLIDIVRELERQGVGLNGSLLKM